MDGDQDLEDLSVASSVPTDLSISEISDLKFEQKLQATGHGTKPTSSTRRQAVRDKDQFAKQMLEKRQLEHDLQLSKIDLKQKEYLLESLRTEFQMKSEDMEEKLAEYKHQKKILQAKCEGQLSVQQEEARRSQDRHQQELASMRKKLSHLESANRKLGDKAADIKHQLRDHKDIDEEKYYELRSLSDDAVGVKEQVALKIFECLRPFKQELDETKSRLLRLQTTINETENENYQIREELDREKKENAAAQVKVARLSAQVQDLSVKADNKDYRIDNYDRINRERQDFERQLVGLREKNITLESEFSKVEHDKKHYETEYEATKSAHTLLLQDKDYLTRQVSEMTNKLAYSEDRLQRQTIELDEVKHAREQLFDKYITSREQFKSQYEQQLQAELKHMSVSTQEEVEKLRATTKAMYEMESRTLRESRDIAMAERDKALSNESEMTNKYHTLNDEYRRERSTLETKISQLTGEFKMAEYEKNRATLLYEETNKNCKDFQVDNEKLIKKLEVANKEYYSLELKMSKQVNEFESRVKEQNTRLQAYENIEKELDEVILQAAEIDDEDGSEKALFSYGYGATIPSSSHRRMKQSVHLARRCLSLERKSVGDKREIDELKLAIEQLKEQCEETNSKLNQAEQPYSYLVNKTAELEAQVRQLKQINYTLENDLKSARKKLEITVAEKKRMITDLEHASKHQQEISIMKESLKTMVAGKEGKPARVSRKASQNSVVVEYQTLQRAKKLIETGRTECLDEAAILLSATQVRENVANRVQEGSMDLTEAINYIDTYLLKHGRKISESMSRKLASKRSDPLITSNKSTATRQAVHNPDASTLISINRTRKKRPPFRVGSPSKAV